MSRSAIFSTLVQAYEDAALGLPTANEGRDFDPPATGVHARLHLLGGGSDQRGQTVDKNRELFQIDLRVPKNTGTRELTDTMDLLMAHFAVKRRFVQPDVVGGQAVTIQSRTSSGTRPDGAWTAISLSIVFTAAVDR